MTSPFEKWWSGLSNQNECADEYGVTPNESSQHGGSGRAVSALYTDNPDENADDRGPERNKKEQAQADRVGIWIGPQAQRRSQNDEQQRTGT